MIRSIAAVIVGFFIMTMIVMITTVITVQIMYGQMSEEMMANLTPPPAYLVVNMLSGIVAALIGGYYTAWIARHSPIKHGIGLAVIVLLMGVVSFVLTPSGYQPVWYPYVIPILGAISAVIGSWLRG